MSRLGALVTGVVVGGGLVYGSLNYHVLRTDEGLEMVPKAEATFSDTYLDVRNFGVSDWADHEQVAHAVLKAGKDHILKDAAAHSVSEGLNSLWNRMTK